MHHRLLEVGHSQRRAVALMYGLTAVIAGTAVALAFVPVVYGVLILVVGLAGLTYAAMRPRIARARDASNATTRTGTDP